MKFCKKYGKYMDGVRSELPAMDLKKIKKTMKRCRKKSHSKNMKGKLYEDEYEYEDEACSDDHHCPVCDETFFPSLQREMTIVVRCFNEKAKKLLELHLPTGFQRFTLWLKGSRNKQQYHDSLIQQGKDLVNYAIINSMALRKMLKKYDKIHRSKQGQAFKMQIQIMHIEILRSPWLCELLAFYLNNSNSNSNSNNNSSPIGNDIHGLLKDMSLTFDEGSNKPSLTCGFFDSFSINVDLTCSICLDTVFDPISLACGHIFCYICACGAASETIIDGLREASSESKCPLCRQEGVYRDYVRLTELNILLRENCHAYWEKRLQSERMDRLQQAKEYWDAQCRNIIGI